MKHFGPMRKLSCLVAFVALNAQPYAMAQEADSNTLTQGAQPFVTAPMYNVNPDEVQVIAGKRKAESLPLHATLKTMPARITEAPWVLTPETHPWPLRYSKLPPINTLYIAMPSMAEARLQLPGVAARTLESASYTVTQYITNVQGMVTQSHLRQQEQLEQWMERTTAQAADVPSEPWPQYQFNQEARGQLEPFRNNIEGQSDEMLARMRMDIQRAIDAITPVMAVMPTHELRLGWYNLMLQLREAYEQMQQRAQESDQQLLAAADAFLNALPSPVLPTTPPPSKESLLYGVPKASTDPAALATMTPSTAIARRDAAAEPAVTTVEPTGGGIVLSGVVVLLAAAVVWLRRKKQKSKAALPT